MNWPPTLVSIRNIGLAAGIELAARPGAVGQRGAAAQAAAFDHGLLTRAPGDTLILAPPFTSTPEDINQMVERMHAAITQTHGDNA
jgi:beta-alanine--pyruvate transaminase